MTPRLKELFFKEIQPALKNQFGFKNIYMGPKIEKIVLNMGLGLDGNDTKILKSEIVREIYSYPAKRVILVSDVQFSENYLVYVDNVKSVSINKDSKDFEKYFNLSKVQMLGSIYNTYDFYLKNKYEIDINQAALSTIKNNF